MIGQDPVSSARTDAVLIELARQLEHWRLATERLASPDGVAQPAVWQSLEHYLGVSLRSTIAAATHNVRRRIATLEQRVRTAGSDADVMRLRRELVAIRRLYLRTETTVDFFADALATRATEPMGSWLRACDHLANRAMAEVLVPLGRQVPATLTFCDKGAGAAIWKMGIRLWDGTVDNPVAAIKVTRHNLLRPTAALHEVGHQISHVLGWNQELRRALTAGLSARSPAMARIWAGWASEIAGDAFAFGYTGYGAVSALHDVIDGDGSSAFVMIPDDPHPVGFLRLMLGVAMCRRAFGSGLWDRLADAWTAVHPVDLADAPVRQLVEQSLPALPDIVDLTLYQRYRAFGDRALADILDPRRVSPAALGRLERDMGAGGLHSRHWVWDEAIRLLALTSYRTTRDAASLREGVTQQEAVMRRLGLQRAA